MEYEELVALCGRLSYRDKFRLAQLLIQVARKEEERKNPDNREFIQSNLDEIEYVAERLLKSKPRKKAKLLNFIGAIFQFKGGISDNDKERIVNQLQSKKKAKHRQEWSSYIPD
ncbi:MAG: hypothetical protein EA395_05715 [Phormidium sp. GEM2.Bin31]|nr:MAG: hypothetical protein EA395_05715 [Phormidium sp. GEM2.Bin31]